MQPEAFREFYPVGMQARAASQQKAPIQKMKIEAEPVTSICIKHEHRSGHNFEKE
jgi:hypothetical protein